MSELTRRTASASVVLLALFGALASCGQSSNEDRTPSSSGGSSNTSGGSSGNGGLPTIVDPSGGSLNCGSSDVPGAACDDDAKCWGTHCGLYFGLVCETGTWQNSDISKDWELVCPTGNESVSDISAIQTGACCGELLPRNAAHTEPSCELCPQFAPEAGAPCSLPADCAPQIIDCFYDCCCYGDTVWAQCDGETWHVATNCSGKL